MRCSVSTAVIDPNMHLKEALYNISSWNPHERHIHNSMAKAVLNEAHTMLIRYNKLNKQKGVFIHRDKEFECFAGCDIEEVRKSQKLQEAFKEIYKRVSLVVDLEDNTNIIVTFTRE